MAAKGGAGGRGAGHSASSHAPAPHGFVRAGKALVPHGIMGPNRTKLVGHVLHSKSGITPFKHKG